MVDFNPGSLYLNIVDFLGTLIPGLIAYGLLASQFPKDVDQITYKKNESRSMVAILLLSYVLGQLLVGFSGLLVVVDRHVNTYEMFCGDAIRLNLIQQADTCLTNYSDAFPKLKEHYSNKYDNEDEISEWAQAVLALKNTQGASVVDHARAEARLFRSLSFLTFSLCVISACSLCRPRYQRLRIVATFKRLPLSLRNPYAKKFLYRTRKVFLLLVLGVFFYCVFSQRQWESITDSYRYLLLLKKAAPTESSPSGNLDMANPDKTK